MTNTERALCTMVAGRICRALDLAEKKASVQWKKDVQRYTTYELYRIRLASLLTPPSAE